MLSSSKTEEVSQNSFVFKLADRQIDRETTTTATTTTSTTTLHYYYSYKYKYTSSTAQGGGGSFKNRKPTGEVGCCESRMAERIH